MSPRSDLDNAGDQSFVRLALCDGTPRRAALTAVVVGSILVAINQGDQIVEGHWPPTLKIALTYVVPYCVTTWGAVIGKRSRGR